MAMTAASWQSRTAKGSFKASSMTPKVATGTFIHTRKSQSRLMTPFKAAGAITVGKTNTPEFGAGSQPFNEVFGRALNPYDPSKTCGGSSGGRGGEGPMARTVGDAALLLSAMAGPDRPGPSSAARVDELKVAGAPTRRAAGREPPRLADHRACWGIVTRTGSTRRRPRRADRQAGGSRECYS